MTPQQAIDALDRGLGPLGSQTGSGEDVILQRPIGNNQGFISVKCRAQVNGYKPVELIANSGIQQGDSMAILSPTQINEAQWPGAFVPGQPGVATGDPRIPMKGDRMIVGGKTRSVQAAATRDIGGVLVRLEVQIR
jgi:hypothetical protein